jgi:hypothetical protein
MILWAAAALGAAVVATAAAPGDTSTYRLLQSGPALGCSQFDFDDSGAVQVNDLLLCLGAFGHPADAEQPAARFAVSGGQQVGVADLLLVLGAYGSTCSPAAGAGGPAAAIDDTTATDECGCTAGEGWSSGAGACAEGSSTSAAEAIFRESVSCDREDYISHYRPEDSRLSGRGNTVSTTGWSPEVNQLNVVTAAPRRPSARRAAPPPSSGRRHPSAARPATSMRTSWR